MNSTRFMTGLAVTVLVAACGQSSARDHARAQGAEEAATRTFTLDGSLTGERGSTRFTASVSGTFTGTDKLNDDEWKLTGGAVDVCTPSPDDEGEEDCFRITVKDGTFNNHLHSAQAIGERTIGDRNVPAVLNLTGREEDKPVDGFYTHKGTIKFGDGDAAEQSTITAKLRVK
jgi:hypothetical protein